MRWTSRNDRQRRIDLIDQSFRRKTDLWLGIKSDATAFNAMLDAAFKAVRFDEAWAINSRRDFIKALKAMVRTALDEHSKTG